MAGQIAELARDTLRKDFRDVDPRTARILLVEAADRVLTTFPPLALGEGARSLERIGVHAC
jgi:NADH dehydrogenase